jgi:hypothetical protein
MATTGQLAAEPEDVVAHAGHLAGGEAVPVGARHPADERAVIVADGAALDVDAAQRVGPIEDDDLDAERRRGLHHVQERPDVGVVARADVLDVVDHRVEAGEHLGMRPQRGLVLAVERIHRQAGDRVAGLGDADHVLSVAANAVLGAEQADDVDALLDEGVDDVPQVGRHRGRIDQETDAFSGEAGIAGEDAREAGVEHGVVKVAHVVYCGR